MAVEMEVLTNHVKVSKLLVIPRFMDLEMFSTSRQERALDGLLKLLTEVVEKHVEEQVLGEAFSWSCSAVPNQLPMASAMLRGNS